MLNDINTEMPGFMTQLDGVATTLRDQVNSVVSPISGTLTPAARDQSAAGALQFSVALDRGAVTNVSVVDANIAIRLSDMSSSTTGADTAYNTMIVQLGVAAKDAQTRDDIQSQSVQILDSARTSQAGVNTDEEMTNMVEYQKAYEASAKFISAIDSMLSTLINMVGH